MAKRITNQQQMQEARRSVDFCHICGQSLHGARGQKGKVMDEHVIPQGIYGPMPANPRDRWRIVLDAHTACESKLKQPADGEAVTEHRFQSRDANRPKDGQIRKLGYKLVWVQGPDGRARPAVDVPGGNERAVGYWVGGIHAALYAIPINTAGGFFALPPAPVADCALGSEDELAERGDVIRNRVVAAVAWDNWDGVDAWGGGVRYRCVWWKQPDARDNEDSWVCAWTLSSPAVESWAQLVTPGVARPWHGFYTQPELPEGASHVTDQFFENHVKLLGG
jgi:hypothetical protein